MLGVYAEAAARAAPGDAVAPSSPVNDANDTASTAATRTATRRFTTPSPGTFGRCAPVHPVLTRCPCPPKRRETGRPGAPVNRFRPRRAAGSVARPKEPAVSSATPPSPAADHPATHHPANDVPADLR